MTGLNAQELGAIIGLLQNLSGLATLGFFMWLVAVHVVPWAVPFWALVRFSGVVLGWLQSSGNESRKLRGLRNLIAGPSAEAVTELEFAQVAELLADGLKWRDDQREKAGKLQTENKG